MKSGDHSNARTRELDGMTAVDEPNTSTRHLQKITKVYVVQSRKSNGVSLLTFTEEVDVLIEFAKAKKELAKIEYITLVVSNGETSLMNVNIKNGQLVLEYEPKEGRPTF